MKLLKVSNIHSLICKFTRFSFTPLHIETARILKSTKVAIRKYPPRRLWTLHSRKNFFINSKCLYWNFSTKNHSLTEVLVTHNAQHSVRLQINFTTLFLKKMKDSISYRKGIRLEHSTEGLDEPFFHFVTLGLFFESGWKIWQPLRSYMQL